MRTLAGVGKAIVAGLFFLAIGVAALIAVWLAGMAIVALLSQFVG